MWRADHDQAAEEAAAARKPAEAAERREEMRRESLEPADTPGDVQDGGGGGHAAGEGYAGVRVVIRRMCEADVPRADHCMRRASGEREHWW